MNFYLSKDGKQLGPYSVEQLQFSLEQGFVSPTDLVWADGWPAWMEISKVPGLTSGSTPGQSNPKTVAPALPAIPALSTVVQGRIRPKENVKRMVVGAGVFVGFIAWIVLFGWGISMAGRLFHPQSPRDAIKVALQQDAKLSSEYKTEGENINSQGMSDEGLNEYADLTSNLASAMKRIDIRDCPSDFQDAYRRHINCWSAMANAVARHPHVRTGGEQVLNALVSGLGNEMGEESSVGDEYASFKNELASKHLEINSSWQDVQDCAAKYGVQPDDY